MREHAGLDVALGIDVQVSAATGDAAANELAVVLEVKGEQRLLLASALDEAIELLALLGRGHKLAILRGIANRHEGEDPCE